MSGFRLKSEESEEFLKYEKKYLRDDAYRAAKCGINLVF